MDRKQIRPKFTIQGRIFSYIFSFALLAISVISIVLFIPVFRTLKTSETTFAVLNTAKTKYNIEFALRLITNTGGLLGRNKDLNIELHNSYDQNSANYRSRQNRIGTMLQDIISVQEYIQTIYVINPNGSFYSSNWGVNEAEVKDFFEAYGVFGDAPKEIFTNVHSVDYKPELHYSVISYIRPIYDLETEELLGTILFDIDYNSIKEILTISSIQNDEKVIILNLDNEVVFTFPYNVVFDDVLEKYPELLKGNTTKMNATVFGADSIISTSIVAYAQWRLISIISSDFIHQQTRNLETIILLFFLAFFLISLALSFALARTVTGPIREFNEKFKLVQQGDLSTRTTFHTHDEIQEMGETFNVMVTQLKSLIEEQVLEQKRKSDLEYQVLQAQINPHFLYNTLDSIRWLASINKVPAIADMISVLIHLLRYNISNINDLVPFTDELNSVQNYIKILKYRYGDDFNVEYDIADSVKSLFVVRFILQPIIENSILHGFENLEGPGLVLISARIAESRLIIEVSDNGVGMDSPALENLSKTDSSRSRFSGIGIHNVEGRIHAHHGKEYGIAFASAPNKGTTTTFTLPLIVGEVSAQKPPHGSGDN